MGILRLLLAIAVIVGHAGGGRYFGFIWMQAFEAVNVFFIISGFYMALVLNERYSTPSTNRVFYLNRWLRLYPLYILGLLLAMAGKAYQGNLLLFFYYLVELNEPQKIFALFSNLLIFGQDWLYALCQFDGTQPGNCDMAAKYTINPPSWTLAAELSFYVMAPLILRCSKRTLIFLSIGIAYAALIRMIPDVGKMLVYSYYLLPASFLYFGLGAASYHFLYRRWVRGAWSWTPREYAIAIVLLAFMTLQRTILPWHFALFYAVLVPVLFHLTQHNRFDRWVGELSYPVYILHLPVLMFLRAEKMRPYIAKQEILSWAVPITLIAAVIAWYLLERPMDRWRHTRSRDLLALANRDDMALQTAIR